MSQRGTRHAKSHTGMPRYRGYIGNIITTILLLTCSLTYTLRAQDSPITPTHTVTIHADGVTRTVVTDRATAGEVLLREKIVQDQYDRMTPLPDTPVHEGMAITVTRVTREIVSERIAMPPRVITRWTAKALRAPVVLQPGRPGIVIQRSEVWKIDGRVSAKNVLGTQVAQAPSSRVIIRSTVPSRGLLGRTRVLQMVATAYDPQTCRCNRTAIGMRATTGVIAVDPRVIPLGSRVHVEGYGYAIAGDTGGAIKGNIIDVCYPTRREAINWGRRRVTVTVLE